MNLEKIKLIESLKKYLITNPIESSAPIYQPIYFKEFDDIKTSLERRSFYQKFDTIFKYIDKDLINKKVLDIGSNAGFFSFAAAERNAMVDALEPRTSYFDLCQRLHEIYHIGNISFVNAPLSIKFLENKRYDYGFMLSVFQWISEGNNKIEFAKNLLLETSKHVDVLFFELGCNSGKSAVLTNKINHVAYIYILLCKNTIYKNIKFIGSARLWGRSFSRYIFICSNKDLHIKEPIYSFLKFINI